MSNVFGPHLIIDGKRCGKDRLTDKKLVYDVLNKLPSLIGMTKIKEPDVLEYKDKFAKTPGYTGVVILAESHISIHTFPDFEYVFIDIFSCRPFDVENAKEYLINAFKIEEVDVNLVKRGRDFNKQVLNMKPISERL